MEEHVYEIIYVCPYIVGETIAALLATFPQDCFDDVDFVASFLTF